MCFNLSPGIAVFSWQSILRWDLLNHSLYTTDLEPSYFFYSFKMKLCFGTLQSDYSVEISHYNIVRGRYIETFSSSTVATTLWKSSLNSVIIECNKIVHLFSFICFANVLELGKNNPRVTTGTVTTLSFTLQGSLQKAP